MRLIISFLLILSFSNVVIGQEDRFSEPEIREEDRFLNALQLRLLEDWDAALEAYTELERDMPDSDIVYFELAKIYLKKGMIEKAVEYSKKALNLDAERKIYLQFLMDILKQARDFRMISEELSKYIDDNEFQRSHYYLLARSYSELKMYKDALKIMDKLEKKEGYSERLGKARTRYYHKTGNNKKLIREWERLSKEYPDQKGILLQKAIAYNNLGKEKKAIEVYQEILKLDPDNLPATMYLSSKKNNPKTESDYVRSLQPIVKNENISMDTKIKQIIPHVAKLQDDNKAVKELLKLLDVLQLMYPGEAKINALHGDIYFNGGLAAGSIPYYTASLKKFQGIFDVWRNLMLAQDHELEFQGLEETAEKALDYYPNQAICYYYLGKANVELDKLDNGVEWLKEGVFMTGNNARFKSEFHLMLSYAYAKMENSSKVELHFSKVVQNHLGNNLAFYHEVKGDFLFLQGKKEEAMLSWKQALELKGRAQRLNQKIKSLQ